jgi:hypothetical protein
MIKKNNIFLKSFVNDYKISTNRYSCLFLAIRDARTISGRNLKTGQQENIILSSENTFMYPNSFISVINYLLILDMIGEIFTLKILPKSFNKEKTNNIYKSLKQFSSLTDQEIDVFIALRNSLAHNYSLINIPRSRDEYYAKLHKFILSNESKAPLIKLPKSPWNGMFNNKTLKSSTTIGVIKLFEIVESVYSNLKVKTNLDLVI